jgi:membrane-associated phospholipid phosphatase
VSYEDTVRGPVALRGKARRWLADAERLDRAVYAAIANTPTPALDRALRQVTRAADHSKLSLAAAGALTLAGGPTGRRAAAQGLASLAVTSVVVNAGLKLAARRRRPDPSEHAVPESRQVRMPISRSFPSGHSAAAFAFATGVGEVSPGAALPLRALAVVVAYSRVHTGVHYPGDVIAGALAGVSLAELTGRVILPRALARAKPGS